MKQEIYNTLDRLGIDYTRLEHPPIMTMEEGMTIAQKLGVSPCKNLFLINKQKECYIIVCIRLCVCFGNCFLLSVSR